MLLLLSRLLLLDRLLVVMRCLLLLLHSHGRVLVLLHPRVRQRGRVRLGVRRVGALFLLLAAGGGIRRRVDDDLRHFRNSNARREGDQRTREERGRAVDVADD